MSSDMIIQLESDAVRPGGVLRGVVRLDAPSPKARYRVELSVRWGTSGKGTEDSETILLKVLADGDPAAARAEHPFETTLPLLPWSFRGKVLSIVWYVRVRRIHPMSADEVVDAVFEMRGPRAPSLSGSARPEPPSPRHAREQKEGPERERSA